MSIVMCAFFDWSDEVHKQSKKQGIALTALLFVIGLLLFFYPVVTQVSSYQADEEAYEELAMEFMPPEFSPEPVLPIPKRTETSAEKAMQDISEESPIARADYSKIGKKEDENIVTDHSIPAAPSDAPEAIAEPETAESARQLTEEKAAPAAAITTVPTKKPSSSTSASAQSNAGINLDACLAQNRDFAAWLSIPGTKINYPVVRSDNTEYYLHHLFTGKQSKLGCLFSLKSSDYQTPSKNIAIYGHHISHSDAMFSTLMNYKADAYCAAHSQICLNSLYGERTYRVFAVLNMKVSDWDAATADFSSDESFQRFINRAVNKSMVDTGVQVTAEDNILTLITCDRSYGGASGRLIVMAVQE